MDDPSSLRAVAAYDAVKKLLKVLQDKGVITGEEAFGVLEESVDDAESNLTEIQNESDVQS
ncbi:hypothetical protein [Deinococcus peraridilitoris]|uniref:Uncharacterized protein n=1 Tax=Deinococcus peraridilitoris (strain DSM 19664 / LMG 22246 / CIP 109416 / KR-200) TaxID=937777 RepID=K9ZX89_DEIPD|nr:hypothetical protein [Deinococcus peraridilitoris]AFZ65814.1 hypothetical protein Deipe_0211 [Deinococcus peraridilitoris DSM 19664]